jgi:hypothetical protein
MYSFNLSTIQNKSWEFWVNIGHTVVPTSYMKFPRNYYRGALREEFVESDIYVFPLFRVSQQ